MQVDHDVDVLAALNEEVSRLRGIGSVGAAPMLDSDVTDGHGAAATAAREEEDDDAGIALQLEQMQEQALAAQADARRNERETLLGQLLSRDESARAERDALNGYMEEMRTRQDEAGDAVRGVDFASEVDSLAQQQRSGAAAAASGSAGDVAQIIQHVQDPATFEALLEVQRLDEALVESARPPTAPEKKAAGAPTGGKPDRKAGAGTGAARSSSRPGSQSRSKLPAQPQSQSQPQSQQRSRQPLLTPSSSASGTPRAADGTATTFLTSNDDGPLVGGASSDAVNALAEEIQKLRGIDAAAASDRLSSASAASVSMSEMEQQQRSDGLVVGGRRSVGGVWISVVDEARIDRLLGEDAALTELEAAVVDDAAYACPDGEGYRPCAEEAERLRQIEASLAALAGQVGVDDTVFRQLQALPPLEAAEASAMLSSSSSALGGAKAAGGHSERFENYLGENKQQRADAATLDRVRDRLAALHQTPSNEPPTGAEELQQFNDLLACVRQAAEQQLDAGRSVIQTDENRIELG